MAEGWTVYCVCERGSEEFGPCKVGIAENMSKRLSSLQGGNWRPLAIAWAISVPDREMAYRIEQYCLGFLRPNPYGDKSGRKRLKSEWVDGSPAQVKSHADRVVDAYLADGEIAA